MHIPFLMNVCIHLSLFVPWNLCFSPCVVVVIGTVDAATSVTKPNANGHTVTITTTTTADVASADTSYPGARAASEREPKASRATVVSDAVADTHGATGVASGMNGSRHNPVLINLIL